MSADFFRCAETFRLVTNLVRGWKNWSGQEGEVLPPLGNGDRVAGLRLVQSRSPLGSHAGVSLSGLVVKAHFRPERRIRLDSE